MPVYTVQQGRKLLSYHGLPVLRLLLEWAVAHPKVNTSQVIFYFNVVELDNSIPFPVDHCSMLIVQGADIEGVYLAPSAVAWTCEAAE